MKLAQNGTSIYHNNVSLLGYFAKYILKDLKKFMFYEFHHFTFSVSKWVIMVKLMDGTFF